MRQARLAAQSSAEHGRYIYAYCNIRTKQVVYSLTQTLNSNKSIKQLPDIGANNTPTSIRKDLWRPLYTLALPSSHPHALAQGLHAFKKLREYRKLHELCWTPSSLLSKPYSDADIEREREKLEDRGGSKKESVYDVIKRRKWRMRVKEVMDQKANSVADLAAVLGEQEEAGRKMMVEREAEGRVQREREVKEMLELAESAGRGELVELEREVESTRERMEGSMQVPEGVSKGQLRREYYRLNARRLRMQFAANAVADAKDPARRQRTSDEQQAPGQNKAVSQQPATQTSRLDSQATQAQAYYLRHLARQAENGALAGLDARIASLQIAILDTPSDSAEEAALRHNLHGLRKLRRQMQLAVEAKRAEGYSGDMVAEVEGTRVKKAEYRVQQAGEEIEEAERQGLSEERVEVLRAALAKAEGRLKELKGGRGDAGTDIASEADVAPETVPTTPSDPPTIDTPPPTPPTDQAAGATASSASDWHAHLPSFPPRDPSKLPKRGPLRAKHRRDSKPSFSTDNITIKWHDPLDAEYAAAWPENVKHERMGWSRYTAPPANQEAIEDVAEWRKGSWGGKGEVVGDGVEGVEGGVVSAGEALERQRVEFEVRRRRDFVEGVKGEILRRVRERDEVRERERVGRVPEVGAGAGGGVRAVEV